jgi:hypothetical protein
MQFQFGYTKPVARVLCAALCLAGAIRSQDRSSEPHSITIGGVKLQPGGFVDVIGMSRSASTGDSISTRFGSIPLTDTEDQSIVSLRNSRLRLMGDRTVGELHFSGFLESDFLNVSPGQSDFRWRHYWVRARFRSWELMGGQAWSLLRPNRKGYDGERDMMHTEVIDAAYHVGLLGSRRRQIRLSRSFGAYKSAFAWETQGNFLARFTADGRLGHLDATAFTGHHDRRGITVAGQVNLRPRLRFVTQQYWSKRAIFEALGVISGGPNGMASLEGLEFVPARNWQVYSYGGLVYGSRSLGNRLVREFTVGADRFLPLPDRLGVLRFSVQYTKSDRFTWAGRSGNLDFVMYRMRYTFL